MSPGERFRDTAYQRYAQSFRSRESLSKAGKAGYKATLARYGKEFVHDRAADTRREREEPRSRSERRMARLLEELGEREDRSEYGGTRGTTTGSTSWHPPGTPTSPGRRSTRR